MKLRRILSCMMALLLVCSLPLTAFAAEYDLAKGHITVTANGDGQYVTQENGVQNYKETSDTVIKQTGSETSSTTNTVTIQAEKNATANVTIQDVNIDTRGPGGAAIWTKGDGNVVIELDGSNTVQSGITCAGVEKNNGGNLTITDKTGTDGSLNATGGQEGAGIGGGYCRDGSNIIISGNAEVTAQGSDGGSGIGGGRNGSGSKIIIEGNTEVNAQGGVAASGIGGGFSRDGSNITISGSAEVTANGGEGSAGVGGGAGGSGSKITITGSAEVTAQGGKGGSGIGGGIMSTDSSITVSGDAQVKAQGGEAYQLLNNYYGAGAAIGEGGKQSKSSPDDIDGEEKTPCTDNLNEGWIATYAPGTTDLDTADPDTLTYKGESGVTTSTNVQFVPAADPTCEDDGNTAGFRTESGRVDIETLPATGHSFTNYVSDNNATYEQDGTKTAKCDHPGCDATDTIPDPGSKLVKPDQSAPLYWVTGQDGKGLSCETEQKDGILTITVDEDSASLTGYLGGLQALSAQGVETIVFVTNGVTSTFALADLLATMTAGDSYTLTHDGSTVTFTLGNGTDISGILK